MTDKVGHEIPRAMPITMTFYDSLVTYPYTSTFYVPESTPDDDVNRLITAVRALSGCALGKYKIGYRPFIMPEFDEAIKQVQPQVYGTFKWTIKYVNAMGLSRSHSIPGTQLHHRMGWLRPGMKKAGDNPNLDHEDWKTFLAVFNELCVSSMGEKEKYRLEVKMSKANWPPSGWKKRK